MNVKNHKGIMLLKPWEVVIKLLASNTYCSAVENNYDK